MHQNKVLRILIICFLILFVAKVTYDNFISVRAELSPNEDVESNSCETCEYCQCPHVVDGPFGNDAIVERIISDSCKGVSANRCENHNCVVRYRITREGRSDQGESFSATVKCQEI